MFTTPRRQGLTTGLLMLCSSLAFALDAAERSLDTTADVDMRASRTSLGANTADLQGSAMLETPHSLRSVVYSPRHPLGYSDGAAELFWGRQGPGQRFEVRREGATVRVTDGTSHFFAPSLENETWEVLAVDGAGNASAPARIIVFPGGPSAVLETPRALRSVVYSPRHPLGYSDGAAELFWERQGPGQRFEVRREGETVTVTDGTSHFFAPALEEETWEVLAVDGRGNASAPAQVVVVFIRNDGPVLDPNLADSILREYASIANGDFFPQFMPIVQEEFNELFNLWIPDSTVSSNSYALIEGSRDEPLEEGLTGLNGGRYTCLAGGSVALPEILGGPISSGFLVRFDQCMTVSDTLGATVTFDGMAHVFPAGRDFGGAQRYTALSVVSDAFELEIDGSYTNGVDGRGERSFGDVERTVSRYARTTDDGLSESVSDYHSVVSVDVDPSGSPDASRTGSAAISFVASTPILPGESLSVGIELRYDGSGTPAEGRVDQWNSGQILIRADDGSRIRAEPIADDPTTLRIVVGDVTLERPWAEGYQIDCVGELSGCR